MVYPCYYIINGRYFAIHELNALLMINFREQFLFGMLEEVKYKDNQYQQILNKVLDNTSLITKTSWLRYNKWKDCCVNQDMKELYALMDLPNVSETKETIIVNIFDTMAYEC